MLKSPQVGFGAVFFLHNELPAVVSNPWRPAQPIVLLPCLPPANTLQVDVNWDAVWPPGSSCVQEHAHADVSHHPKSSPLSVSELSFCQQLNISCLQQAVQRSEWPNAPDCSSHTGEHPVVYQGSKVSAKTPFILMSVSIETGTGEPGRILMASQWADEAPPHAAVCHEKQSCINPLLIINFSDQRSKITLPGWEDSL